MKHVVVNTLAALFVIAGMGIRPVLANDTAAVLGAGGLELTTSDDIMMVSEDLYLSPDEIRVRYTFRNESSRDITTTVAFPLPPVDQSAHSEIVFLPMEDQENFVGFRVWVDGQPIQPKLEQKATTDSDADVTAELSRAGLPVNASLPGWKAKLHSLPNNLRQQLIKQGLLDVESGRANSPSAEFSPNWTLEATFHWDQTFPAGKTIVVEHRYKPIVGGVSSFDASQIGD